MLEQIDEGTILLDVEGKRVGVINGLVVYNFSRYSFGKPARITTQVRMGSGEFLNIEREIEMSRAHSYQGRFDFAELACQPFCQGSAAFAERFHRF